MGLYSRCQPWLQSYRRETGLGNSLARPFIVYGRRIRFFTAGGQSLLLLSGSLQWRSWQLASSTACNPRERESRTKCVTSSVTVSEVTNVPSLL